MYKAGNVLSERMIDLNKTDFCDLVERIKDSFMEIDSDRKYMSRMFEKETIERCQIYFRGHTDGYVYLKKIGVV